MTCCTPWQIRGVRMGWHRPRSPQSTLTCSPHLTGHNEKENSCCSFLRSTISPERSAYTPLLSCRQAGQSTWSPDKFEACIEGGGCGITFTSGEHQGNRILLPRCCVVAEAEPFVITSLQLVPYTSSSMLPCTGCQGHGSLSWRRCVLPSCVVALRWAEAVIFYLKATPWRWAWQVEPLNRSSQSENRGTHAQNFILS